MDVLAVTRIGAVVGALAALTAGPALAQGSGGGEPSAVVSDARQFEQLAALAEARLQSALLIEEDDEDARKPLLMEAERYARAAAQVAPDEAQGWFLVAASIGLQAQYESTRKQVRMAGEMLSMATTALDRDPNHAGAHHVIGRLNLEAMSLSGMARIIATHLYGSALLRSASWAEAESHLRRAAELEPDALYHRLWLARLHEERGEEDDARRVLEELLTHDPADELDRIILADAAEDLDEL